MARDMVLHGTRRLENFPQTFFVTIITSLQYSLAFYTVCSLEVNRDVYIQEVRIRCESISRVVDSRCWVCLSYRAVYTVHLYKMILRRTKVFKRQFLVPKTKQHFKKVVRSTNPSTESSYKVAGCIAEREKSFTLLYNAIFHRHPNILYILTSINTNWHTGNKTLPTPVIGD